MKKSIALVAMAFGVTSAFAQDLTSKKGEAYLPAAKDIAISLDALPIIGTMGNLMSPNANTTVQGTGGATNYIMAKYFKDEKTAYRAILGLNFGSTTVKTLVPSLAVGAAAGTQVENSTKIGGNDIILGGGLEKRRGSTRLQGYYGGMLMINLGGGKTTNTYGNALTAGGSRATEVKAGSTFGLAVNGFVGAEYFVLPKVSIGAEYWWGLGFNSTGKGTITSEEFDAVSNSVKSTKVETGGASSFGINGQYGTAALFVNLHF
jgi:hypothetical protein